MHHNDEWNESESAENQNKTISATQMNETNKRKHICNI